MDVVVKNVLQEKLVHGRVGWWGNCVGEKGWLLVGKEEGWLGGGLVRRRVG